jgi:activating signal cointegrator complex subunit 1
MPLGHHAALRERVTKFTDALVGANPPIEGIHPSIMINPRRLSFPIARLHLDDTTFPKAQELLTSLGPQLLALISAFNTNSPNRKLRAPLTQLRVSRPQNDDLSQTHVAFVGTSRSDPEWQALWTVASMLLRSLNSRNTSV